MTTVPQALISCAVLQQLCLVGHSPCPTRSQANIRAGITKPPSPSYKAQQLSPAASLCPDSLRTRPQHNAEIRSHGHKSWTVWQRNCSLRCAHWGPAKAFQAEEESQPNPKSCHIHHTPYFLWQREGQKVPLWEQRAARKAPAVLTSQKNNLQPPGEEAGAAPRAVTCAPQLSPGMHQREGSLHPSHQEMPISSVSPTSRALPHHWLWDAFAQLLPTKVTG